MAKVVELTDVNFDNEIKNTDKPVLVDFWAPWCGYCRKQAPIIDELAEELGDKAVVATVNIDDNQQKASEFFISGIPAILVFKNGKPVEQMSGVHQKDQLKSAVRKYF